MYMYTHVYVYTYTHICMYVSNTLYVCVIRICLICIFVQSVSSIYSFDLFFFFATRLDVMCCTTLTESIIYFFALEKYSDRGSVTEKE